MNNKNRIFVALEIPIVAKEYIYGLLLAIDKTGKIKWESQGKFHITLKFLGETSVEKTNEVKNVLSDFVRNFQPFNMTLDRLGGFKRKGEYKILWAGFEENNELKKAAEYLDNRLSEIGFEKEEKQFFPHITLKRLKGNEDKLVLEKFFTLNFEPLNFTADTVTLFRSILKPTGAIYKAIEKYKLGDKNG